MRAKWFENAPPPTTQITGGRTKPDYAFSFTSDQSFADFRCELDTQGFTPCTSPQPYPGLEPGSTHTFAVQATDIYGTDQPGATQQFAVAATTPPPTSVPLPKTFLTEWPGTPTTSRRAILRFRSDQSTAHLVCSMNGAEPPAPCVSGVTYSNLPLGVQTFRVWAIDAAGKDPKGDKHGWTVKAHIASPPVITPVFPTTSPKRTPAWVWVVIGVIIVIAAVVVTLVVRARRKLALLLSWQLEWKSKEPPETCAYGGTYTWRHDCKLTPALRSIEKLCQSANTERDGTVEQPLDETIVAALNEAVHATRLRRGRERLHELLEPAAEQTIAAIAAWRESEHATSGIAVEARLAGGKLECEFERFECVNGHWVKRETWKGEAESESDEPVSRVAVPVEDMAQSVLEADLLASVATV